MEIHSIKISQQENGNWIVRWTVVGQFPETMPGIHEATFDWFPDASEYVTKELL